MVALLRRKYYYRLLLNTPPLLLLSAASQSCTPACYAEYAAAQPEKPMVNHVRGHVMMLAARLLFSRFYF